MRRWIILIVLMLVLITSVAVSVSRLLNPLPACIYFQDGSDSYSVDPRSGATKTISAEEWNLLFADESREGIPSPDGRHSVFIDGNGSPETSRSASIGSPGYAYMRPLLTGTWITSAWSPNSQHVALMWAGDDGYWHFMISDPDGRQPVVYPLKSLYVQVNFLNIAGWSADSRYIALRDSYDLNASSWPYYFFDIETGQVTWKPMLVEVAADDEKYPTDGFAWSPQGHDFAYRAISDNADLHGLLNIGTPSQPVLQSFDVPYMAFHEGMSPLWSADGNYVSIIYGGENPSLTHHAFSTYSTIAGLHGEFFPYLPGLTPDEYGDFDQFERFSQNNWWIGNRYVYLDHNPSTEADDLVAFDPAKNNQMILASNVVAVNYDADKQRFAVQVQKPTGLTLDMMDGDGSHRTTLVQGAVSFGDIEWQDDGLTAIWNQSMDSKHPLAHLTWTDASHVETSQPADYIAVESWSSGATPYIFYLAINDGFQSIHLIDRRNDSDNVVIEPFRIPTDYTQGVSFTTIFNGDKTLIQEPPVEGKANLYVLSLRNRQLKLVTHTIGEPSNAVWSPDGTQIALTQAIDGKLKLDTFDSTGDPLASVPLPPLQYQPVMLRYGYCR